MRIQEARHDDVQLALDDLDEAFVGVDPATFPAGHESRGTEPPPPEDRPHAKSIAAREADYERGLARKSTSPAQMSNQVADERCGFEQST
jgi:hypothetical protein